MLYIRNESLNPYYNLALEEYALKELAPTETLVLLWQNEPSVIVGRFQNTIEEINNEYVRENGIHVVRRITGGGAVYHDLGNLNFTFIGGQDSEGLDFQRFTTPIVQALHKMGVEAEQSGRNDITIHGKKFSGNAQYNQRGRTLHHGTILYNSNLENVQAALNVKADKIESKGVKSVRSRVTNISEYLSEQVPIRKFKELLLQYLFAEESIREYQLTTENLQKINKLKTEKYSKWEWNYGKSPNFNIRNWGRFSSGGVEVLLNVEKGIIKGCTIFGDFFSNEDINEFTACFIGCKYEQEEISNTLKKIDILKFFGCMGTEAMQNLFFPTS